MSELISKKFENLDVTVYGTYEKPLFKASDIGDLLSISKIKTTIQNLEDGFKVLMKTETKGGLQDSWFLTEQGLYKLLFVSRKPIAKTFQSWVVEVITQIRKSGEYKMKKNIEIENKQEVLLHEYSKECSLIYIIKVNTIDENRYILKIGESRAGILGRYKEHKRLYPECLLLDCFIVKNSKQLEKLVHSKLSQYRYRELKDHEKENELFMVGEELTYQMVVNIINENLHTYDNSNTETEEQLKLQIEKLQLENENLKLKAQVPANVDYDTIKKIVEDVMKANTPQNTTNNFQQLLPTVGNSCYVTK